MDISFQYLAICPFNFISKPTWLCFEQFHLALTHSEESLTGLEEGDFPLLCRIGHQVFAILVEGNRGYCRTMGLEALKNMNSLFFAF